MSTYAQILGEQEKIRIRSLTEHAEFFKICFDGIDYIVESGPYMAKFRIAYSTPEEAGRTIAIRYLAIIPSTAMWCLEALSKGQYRIACNILRSLFEEVINMKYYTTFPVLAQDHQKNNETNPHFHEPNPMKKLQKMGFDQSHKFHQIYDYLSEFYAHPKTFKYSRDIHFENNVTHFEPFFNADSLREIGSFVRYLIIVSLETVRMIFPEFALENPDWSGRVDFFFRYNSN